jgi:hypothetical protein
MRVNLNEIKKIAKLIETTLSSKVIKITTFDDCRITKEVVDKRHSLNYVPALVNKDENRMTNVIYYPGILNVTFFCGELFILTGGDLVFPIKKDKIVIGLRLLIRQPENRSFALINA